MSAASPSPRAGAGPRIKFCGLQGADEVALAARLHVDFVGFVVLAPKSPRDVPTRAARSLAQRAPSTVRTVLVTPSENEGAILAAIEEIAPDIVQLTGNVRPRLAAEIPKHHQALVWRTLAPGADPERDLVRARQLAREADAVLVDASAGYGGTGHTVDWARAGQLVNALAPHKVVLAGGLSPGNVHEAAGIVHPWAVDVSSGIETDGNKDPDKMRAFVAALRGVTA